MEFGIVNKWIAVQNLKEKKRQVNIKLELDKIFPEVLVNHILIPFCQKITHICDRCARRFNCLKPQPSEDFCGCEQDIVGDSAKEHLHLIYYCSIYCLHANSDEDMY